MNSMDLSFLDRIVSVVCKQTKYSVRSKWFKVVFLSKTGQTLENSDQNKICATYEFKKSFATIPSDGITFAMFTDARGCDALKEFLETLEIWLLEAAFDDFRSLVEEVGSSIRMSEP